MADQPGQHVQPMPPSAAEDKFLYRTVVLALSALALIGIGGLIYLSANKLDVPEGLVAVTSAAVGALGALLAPSPAR